jgi:serine/threonine protein kinase
VVGFGVDNRAELDALQAICRTEPRSSHIIAVYEIFRLHNPLEKLTCPVVKMELCDGTLDGYLKTFRSLTYTIEPREIVNIMIQILTGLRHCHELGFCHRDLK